MKQNQRGIPIRLREDTYELRATDRGLLSVASSREC
jgi:hypothetical protein